MRLFQARSHWLRWSGFNLITFTQFIQLRFNSVALQTSFVKNATACILIYSGKDMLTVLPLLIMTDLPKGN